MNLLRKGSFVTVGNDVGVIVFLKDETFEDHVGVWYGEVTDSGTPKYRTVPREYCKIVLEATAYH